MMIRREFLRNALASASVATVAAFPATTDRRPNMVVILVDDMRWDMMSCLGHPFLKTPQLDRVRREGVMFSNAFVTTSLCSPSRATFLTGTYAHRHGVTDNTGKELDPDKTPVFPTLLQAGGYETAYVGKWHQGRTAAPRRGFDYWLSFLGQGVYKDPKLNENGRDFQEKGYITDILTDKAVAWLERKREKPFCLYLAHKAIHGPFDPPERHNDLFAGVTPPEPASFREDLASKPAWQRKGQPSVKQGNWPPPNTKFMDYYRVLAAVDDSVGRVYEALKRNGTLDNTVFLFTSDNGYFKGEHAGMGDKRLAYEESMRIPMLLRYPKLAKPGGTIPGMVLNLDVAQTMLDLAGLKPAPTMQGRSMKPLLEGKTKGWRENFLYEYWVDLNTIPRMVGIRTESAKYVKYPDIQDLDELYDLRKDPGELKNLAADKEWSAVKKKLQAELEKLMRDTGYPSS